MGEYETVGAILAIGGTIGGFVTLVAGLAVRGARREHLEKHALDKLTQIEAVSSRLEDVLNHPGDTDFSVNRIREGQKEIMEILERIEKAVKRE